MSVPKDKRIERFGELPQELKDSLTTDIAIETLSGIQEKHGLNIEQSGLLADQISLVILGFTQPNDFPKNLKSALQLPEEKINQIISDVDSQIFQPIRQHLIAPKRQAVSEPMPAEKIKPVEHPSAQELKTQAPRPSVSDELLKEIEKPQKTNAVVGSKLNEPVVIKNQTKKAPQPKQNVPQKSSDPYRESVE